VSKKYSHLTKTTAANKLISQRMYLESLYCRYDDLDGDVLATGGSVDGTVKVWNTSNGTLRATLKGGSSNAIISVDVTNHLVAGGGTDKTVRVWNFSTNRMVHHLVGHANKVTCVRFFSGERGIVTASSDRQIKVWDVSKQTYRQTTNLHLNSTANSIDVGIDSYTVVSGHIDGGLRFWDIRTGQRNAEIERKSENVSRSVNKPIIMTQLTSFLKKFLFPSLCAEMHESAITSVQFHPLDSTKVLTNGMDSKLKIIDIRAGKPIQDFHHNDFQTSYNWSSSSFSPDGTSRKK
jgi:autophagy-related protein 16